MKSVSKCHSNPVSIFKITGTYKNFNQKLQPETSTKQIQRPHPKKVSKLWINFFNFIANGLDTVANVMKNVIIKLESIQSNQVIHFHVLSTLKNCKLKIEKISTSVKKWVNCELKNTIVTENV